jgi:2-polyprenyl-3-methyl-5-hydroxy-6-metoxy-1,4-benzoquinol methylase
MQAQKGFQKLVGVDYSESAVVLAREIADNRQASIDYKVLK